LAGPGFGKYRQGISENTGDDIISPASKKRMGHEIIIKNAGICVNDYSPPTAARKWMEKYHLTKGE
jgi:hypothetical protein